MFSLSVQQQNSRTLFCSTRFNFYIISLEPNLCVPSVTVSQRVDKASRVFYTKAEDASQLITAELLSDKIGFSNQQLSETGYLKISCSNTGRFVGLFWHDECRYQILDTAGRSEKQYTVLEEGQASDFAWFGPKNFDYFAIIAIRTEMESSTTRRRLGTTKKKTIERQLQAVECRQINPNAKYAHFISKLFSERIILSKKRMKLS